MNLKHDEMMQFWTNRVTRFGTDPQANTNDIWLREIEIRCVNKIIKSRGFKHILDFACANGYSTVRLAKDNPGCLFYAIDINNDMIKTAVNNATIESCNNVEFHRADITSDEIQQQFDFIYIIRGLQNLESFEMQVRVIDKLYDLLHPGGFFYYIESYAESYKQLNIDREALNLPPLPIHAHLTLLTEEFEDYVSKKMKLWERSFPSSSYYLITRLLYSYLAMTNGEQIDYNHPIHQVATMVPQIGAYGPQRALLYQKE